jgi:hypothetical protein
VESKVNSKQKPFSIEDFEKMAVASIATYGAPDQVYMGSHALMDYLKFIGSGNHVRCEAFQRFRTRLHCGLKVGTITWQQNDVLEGAAEAFERMGFFKHVPKD